MNQVASKSLLAAALFLAASSGFRGAAAADLIPFSRVAPLFEKHCYSCHAGDKPKGELRIDRLNPDLIQGKDGDHWREVLDRLNFGDMPPETEPALSPEDRELMVSWLVQERRRAARANNSTAHFRRLTRREYELSMQKLLGLDLPFGSKLPEEGRSAEGFRNDGEMLRMSPRQYETYLQIADEALAEAIVSGPPPVVHRYRFEITGDKPADVQVTVLPRPDDRPGESFEYFRNEGKQTAFRIWSMRQRSDKDKEKDRELAGSLPPSTVQRHAEAAVKLPPHSFSLGFHTAFRTGEMRIRVRVARTDNVDGSEKASSRVPLLTVAFGCTNFHGVELKTVGEPVVIDHTDYRTHEFRVRMETMPLPTIGPPADRNAAVLSAWNSARVIKDEAHPPLLKIEWIELESPFLETWRPKSHTDILFPHDESQPEEDYARQVIERFATRAYRRPLTGSELDRLMHYWSESRRTADSFEQSIRETLSVVLSSPQFLGLAVNNSSKAQQRIDDYELAARLSYFLWSSPPDETLLELASRSQLHEPAVLSAQVRRMIRDPQAWHFIEQFTEQWLELDRLQRVTVNRRHYPDFSDDLAAAMRLETLHFFAEVLRNDGNITQLIDSDFTCVNETLAMHYGIEGVTGPQFRRVALEPHHHRGGLLTHASILTGTSDGTDGHPIKRGMWLLKNLFDETPPPPPPTVPELDRKDPKIRDLSIPQAIALHRESASCASCHKKIDPWGLAFEEYDAVGLWQRDGLGAELRKRRTRHPIDATAELPSGVKVDGLAALQSELLKSRTDDLRKALARKLLAYALGRSLTLDDLEAADSLAPTLKKRGDGLATLVELIAASAAFQSK
jgi:mono/diheme cytochrome c family protein